MSANLCVLGLDCATMSCSAAVLNNGIIVAREYIEIERGHAEILVPMILQVLETSGRKISDLDLLAVTAGPGTFTGVRIGLSTAQTLSLAAELPLVGVTTMEVVARAQNSQIGDDLLVVLETKREDIYAQLFSASGVPLSDFKAVTPDELPILFPNERLKIAGDAKVRASCALKKLGRAVAITEGPIFPDAAWVARIGAERNDRGRIGAIEPVYLRPAVVTRS